ncbi:MAG: recombinase family protein [Clostridiaceae bacterium]
MAKLQSIIKEIFVAIYLRLSRDDQNGSAESMSIGHQRDMLMAYCEERGWKVYDIYVDDGFTGTNFERPGFQRMIEDIEKGYISIVLTKDLSRLGRNYVMTGQYTDFFFPEHGVRYVAVNDSYDSDKDDNDIAPFKNILNEMYAKDISKKVRSVRQTSAKQGKFMGSKPPFGYIKSPDNKHQLIIDPPAAAVVKRLFREFAGGESGRNIATKLNAEGVDTPAEYYFKQTGKRATRGDSCQQWGSTTIIQLLRNQVYIGNMVQGKRKVSSFKTKKRLVTTPDSWIAVEDTHEAIIDRLTWDSVQRRMDNAKRAANHAIKTSGKDDEINVFSGIIRCADCGAAMAFNRKVSKNGVEHRFYRCSRYANSGSKSCSMHTIDADTLESIILSDIQYHAQTAIADEKKLTDRLLSFSGQERQNEKAAQEKSLRDAKSRIAFIEDASKRLFEEKISGNVPESLFRKMLADYERELSELEEKYTDLRQSVQEAVSSEADVQNWMVLIKECVSIDRLDRMTAFRLINQVAVHEQTDEHGHRRQSVQVKYNFVGCVS